MADDSPITNSGSLPTRHDPTGISVLIVGAGIGGLAAALECWRKGHTVRIVERSPGPVRTGDFFTIGASAMTCFKYWPDMARENDVIGHSPWVSYYKFTGDKMFGPIEMSAHMDAHHKKGEALPHRHHRPEFYDMLLKQVARTGMDVEFGTHVVEYFEDVEEGKGGVVLKDGKILKADIVIAADGLGTHSEKIVIGNDVRAKSSGYAIFRAAFPVEIALADPVIAEHFQLIENGDGVLEFFLGPDMHATFWRAGNIFTWTLTHQDHISSSAESWHHSVDPNTALAIIAESSAKVGKEWPEYIKHAIAVTPPDSLINWKLMWRNPQHNWTSPAGHVVQLGDAAHTFLPTSGNGGTQAIEDAISLSTCLATASETGIDAGTAAKAHNLLRIQRTSLTQLLGIYNQCKEHALSKNPRSATPKFGEWISQHDPEKYAEAEFARAVEFVKEKGESWATDMVEFENSNVPPGLKYRDWEFEEMERIANEDKGLEELGMGGNWD